MLFERLRAEYDRNKAPSHLQGYSQFMAAWNLVVRQQADASIHGAVGTERAPYEGIRAKTVKDLQDYYGESKKINQP